MEGILYILPEIVLAFLSASAEKPYTSHNMATPVASAQTCRQFYWGLSLGIIVLALAGFVWFGWAISVFESPAAAAVCGTLDAIFTGCLIWAGRRVRREASGFKRSDL